MKNYSRRRLNKKKDAYRSPSRFLAHKPKRVTDPIDKISRKGGKPKNI